MKFSCSFTSETGEIMIYMLTGASKLTDLSSCVLVLNNTSGLEIRAVTDPSSAFGKIDIERFAFFRVQSKANNIIAAEIQISSLVSAFKSVEHAEDSQFKLSKNKNGGICFFLTARTFTQITVTQDIPVVKLLPIDDMNMYREPTLSSVDATIAFPDAKMVKTVLDRMKQLDKFVQLKADQESGTLVFRVDTEVVSVRTVFIGLSLNLEEPAQEGGDSQNKELAQHDSKRRNQFVVATLNTKELSSITGGLINLQKRVSGIVLAIVRGSAVCLHVSFDDESHLTYYLATAVTDESEPGLENDQLLRAETLKGESERVEQENPEEQLMEQDEF